MKNYKLKDDTLNKLELQKTYSYPFQPRDSKNFSDKVFLILDDSPQRGSHWICFIVKITNHITLIASVVNLMNFYLINYPNQ